jgi:hypothetical protein
LSITLKQTGGFAPFLTLCGTTVLIGSLLFLLLPRPAAPDRRSGTGLNYPGNPGIEVGRATANPDLGQPSSSSHTRLCQTERT